MKDAYYFSHDSNAHKDPKVLKLRAKHGWAGYGIFWAIIETLREQEGYRWKASDKQLISFSFANGDEMVDAVIDTCLEVGLLIVDDEGYIHSESLSKRMKKREEVAEKRRQAGKKGGSSKSQANANQSESKERKGKERKVKENIPPIYPPEGKIQFDEMVYLTQEEADRLIAEYGEDEFNHWVSELSNYHIQNADKPSKIKKDHNRTIRNWIAREKRKAGKGRPVAYQSQNDRHFERNKAEAQKIMEAMKREGIRDQALIPGNQQLL